MRGFLKSNTFYAIVSIIIAVLLWAYVAYEVRPTHEIWIEDVQIIPINVSKSFADGSLSIIGENEGVTDGKTTADIKIRGKRNVVSNVTKKDLSCFVDMITVDKEGVYRLKPYVETQYSGIDVIQIKPSNIKLNVENINQRDMDIEMKIKGTVFDGYTIEDLEMKTKTVKLTGPDSILNSIRSAQIVFDYSVLGKSDSEKSFKIEYLDKEGNYIDTSLFNKSIEYCKVTFKLCTEKEVTVILTPKYDSEIKKNSSGQTVSLIADAEDGTASNGGVKLKVKLKGTHDAIAKYLDSETVVYTKPIDVKNIYTETILEDIEAAPLSSDVDYISVPKVDVKASPKTKE